MRPREQTTSLVASMPKADGATPAVASPDSTPAPSSDSGSFDLTNTQQLLWMGQQLHPTAPLYNMALAFTLEGPVDPLHFQKAFQALIDRSDALRIVLEEHEGLTRQRVMSSLTYVMDQVDFSMSQDPKNAAREWVHARAARHFDLTEQLFDSALIRLADDRYVWFLNQHHLITDGWSTALLFRIVSELYERSLRGSLAEAGALPDFRSYVEHERSFRASTSFRKAQEYWQKKTDGALEPVSFYGKTSVAETTRSRRITCDLGADRSAKLRGLAADENFRALTEHVSLFSIFLTLLFAYLHRTSGQNRLAIGTPSHNRPTNAFKATIGVFIEIFPFQVEVAEGDTFHSLYAKVKRETAAFLRYAQPATSTASNNRSLNVLLNYIHASFGSFNGSPVESEWVHAGHADSRHHLRLQVHDFDQSGRFVLHFDFSADRFSKDECRIAVSHFMHMMDGFLEDQTQQIRGVDLISSDEERLTVDFSRPAGSHPIVANVVQHFEAQAIRNPERVSVVCGDRQITFGELNARANQLAHSLRRIGIGRGDAVGLYMQRSAEMVIGILGTLKAGAFYVPIDLSCPTERMAQMLEETSARIVLTSTSPSADFMDRRVLVLSSDWTDLCDEPRQNIDAHTLPTDLAYVIYTSGSTGRPKGVMVEHAALAQYVSWACSYYLDGQALSFPLFTSMAFDLTITSVFTPLLSGGTIVVYGEAGTSSDLALFRVVEEGAVDIIKLTPSHLSLLQNRSFIGSRIKKLILGGEDLKRDLAVSAIRAFGEDVEIYNEYGPTEATVGCMIHRFDPDSDPHDSVPIGRPAGGSHIFLLNDDGRPVATGTAGEICVAGPQLARGYLGRPDLTDDRFVPCPIRPGERMYRTGDLGRWRTDGTMHYLGRNDDQVKIRGHRIELREVEAALQSHPSIATCAVVATSYAPPAPHPRQPLDVLQAPDASYCARCGLPSSYPGATFDADGICNLCLSFDTFSEKASHYFGTVEELLALFERSRRSRQLEYDCLMLLSGGKDSTYALYRLVEMGLHVLTFTLDNGYISDQAKSNIRRVTQDLGVDHVFGSTPAMNAIFVDSLKRHSNVCNGCFKTLYTLSTKMACEKNIPYVVTGLSRGQFFETRLSEELFRDDEVDADRIDAIVLEARKAYHRIDDAVLRLLPVAEFQTDELFDEVQFIDFYRYCDVELDEMLAFLEEHAPWIRPSDTGRSTNCLINDVGIFIHKKERGFHNYAFPYSWDVRMGHKSREAALDELNDEIDPSFVLPILEEIGYAEDARQETDGGRRLIAYYTCRTPLAASDMRGYLARTLPEYAIPSHFIAVDHLPLTANGKVDRSALPRPDEHRQEVETPFVPPQSPFERQLASIWADVLRVGRIGVHDNFFDLGGDSIMAIRVSARATEAGLPIAPDQLFQHQSIAALAEAAGSSPAPGHSVNGGNGSASLITGSSNPPADAGHTPTDFPLARLNDQKLEALSSLLREADSRRLRNG